MIYNELYDKIQTGSLLSLKREDQRQRIYVSRQSGILYVFTDNLEDDEFYWICFNTQNILCLQYDAPSGFGKYLVGNCVVSSSISYINDFFKISQL